MRGLRIAVAVASGWMAWGIALAQAPASPSAANSPAATAAAGPAAEVQAAYARVKPYILKAADKMPPEDYAFKPTPEIRSFARVVNHVTEAQLHVCGAVDQQAPSGRIGDLVAHPTPQVPPETADKATILAALQDSFAECDKAYASITDANMADMFTVGPAKRSRIGLLWGNVSHDNEQYATLALYLRMKGIVPPSSEK